MSASRLRTVASVAVLAVFAPSQAAAQQDEKSLISNLKRAQRVEEKTPEAIDSIIEIVRSLSGLDSQDAFAALVRAYAISEADLTTTREEQLDVEEQLAKSTTPNGRTSLTRSAFTALQKRQDLARRLIDRYVALQATIRDAVRASSHPSILLWLARSVLDDKKIPLPLRLSAAEAFKNADNDESLVKQVVRGIRSARTGTDLVVLCTAIQAIGEEARDTSPTLLRLLKHNDSLVRDRAARALASAKVVEAIEPLIDLLEREKGHPPQQALVAASLTALTGQDLGVTVGSWRAWWADNQASLLAGDSPLGGGMFELPAREGGGRYYFDIPQDGKSIFYVIDASGSMKEPVKLKTRTTTGDTVKVSRLAACKKELISAIQKLNKEQRFNILWYSDRVTPWEESMQDAEPRAIENAVEWIRKLGPNGSTNIFGALQKTFEFTGRGARDKYYDVDFDTVFLLTDGTPTLPSGQVDSTEKIITAVRGWNALKRVTVHCIGIGKGINAAFLKTLASENNGEFRRY